jgi:beta-hydroxylase
MHALATLFLRIRYFIVVTSDRNLMVASTLALRLWPLWMYVGTTSYIHFRGKVKLKFMRQLSDHSTFVSPYNCLMYLFSAVPNKPVQDIERFPDLAPLRDNWETIRDEAKRLYDEGHIKKAENFNDLAFNTFFKRGWKRFYLKWYGDFLPSAKALCPKTVELVQSIPSVNAALFTMMAPRSKLGAHRDPFAGSMRYHLGLMTPNNDDCRIYIDGQPYSWRDGQAILFDETFIHKVNNDTDEPRIILFCDVTRPLRTPIVRALNRFMIRYVVKATQTQNTASEKVGVLNYVSRYVYSMREAYEKRAKKNKGLLRVIQAVGLVLVVAAIAYFGWYRRRG